VPGEARSTVGVAGLVGPVRRPVPTDTTTLSWLLGSDALADREIEAGLTGEACCPALTVAAHCFAGGAQQLGLCPLCPQHGTEPVEDLDGAVRRFLSPICH